MVTTVPFKSQPIGESIMRALKARSIVTTCVASLAMSMLAHAQQAAPQAVPQPPAGLESLQEGEAPAITIRKPSGETKTTEKREQGKVTQVKVQKGKSTYYVKPNDQVGNYLPGDAESSTNRAPTWQIKEFDLGRQRPVTEVEPAQILPPAPPPPVNK